MLKAQCHGFLNTPPLWHDAFLGVEQFEFPEISIDGFQPIALDRKLRLGHQVEHVFQQLLSYSDLFEILLYNLPISRGKVTLGEIDFILENKRECAALIHIELAYKFYVIDPSIEEPIRQLIGPNRRDSFFEKVEKIKQKQFPLLHTKEGIEALWSSGIDCTQVIHQSCFKAQVFRPYDHSGILMEGLNAECIVGYWVGYEDFCSSAFNSSAYYVPSKSEWIIEPHHEVAWLDHAAVLEKIISRLADHYAPMLWKKNTDGTLEKVFVVWW